eukprot:scaffold503423_cov35-Prasinocladus_malaysianus.AAC.1
MLPDPDPPKVVDPNAEGVDEPNRPPLVGVLPNAPDAGVKPELAGVWADPNRPPGLGDAPNRPPEAAGVEAGG